MDVLLAMAELIKELLRTVASVGIVNGYVLQMGIVVCGSVAIYRRSIASGEGN